MSKTVHEYYSEQEVLPTYGKFMTSEEMAIFDRQRRALFTERLYLPKNMFQNARMIEFGPDSGENSLVFARWGADCSLIEPNPKAHAVIREYFQRYKLTDRLKELKAIDILGYGEQVDRNEKFDLIDAEYSIYTVHPVNAWIDIIAGLLKEDGLFIFFYMEAYGSFLELFLKVIHYRLRQLTNWDALEVAQKYLATKWISIPHKRTLEAFVMDVLENPFTRLKYLLEPQSLCAEMQRAGLDLYSSWPPYKDGMSVEWVKKIQSTEETLHEQQKFIAHSRLSHLLGIKCFLLHTDPGLGQALWDLVVKTDSLIDNFDADNAAICKRHLDLILNMLHSDVFFDEKDQLKSIQKLITSIQHIFDLLIKGSVEEILEFCNKDESFIQNWGSPAHATIFRRRTT